MNTEIIQTLTSTFEASAQQTEGGVDYWLARDIQHLLGYAKWDNFLNVVSKAKTACDVSGRQIPDHFADVGKMVNLGSGSQREVDDIMLTRYACYLIAQNGDPKKQEIAFAQTYFAIQTRRAELIEQRLLEAERVSARHKLSATEKELGKLERAAAKARATADEKRSAAAVKATVQPVLTQLAALEAALVPYEAIKTQLAEARARYHILTGEFVNELKSRCDAINADQKRALVLELFAQDVQAGLDAAVAEKRQELVRFIEGLWDKYRVTMAELRNDRIGVEKTPGEFFKQLSYA
jgi:hypothetical protein